MLISSFNSPSVCILHFNLKLKKLFNVNLLAQLILCNVLKYFLTFESFIVGVFKTISFLHKYQN